MSDGMEEKPAETAEVSGGLGGRSERDESGLTAIRVARMERQAIESRWEIPEKDRAAVVRRQVEIATGEQYGPKEATNAARCLALMDDQNIEQEKRGEPEPAGVTVNIQNNDYRNMDDRRAEFNSIVAAALERARKAETSGATDAAADTLAAVPPTPID